LSYKDQVLECLKFGIDFPKGEQKVVEYHHARDNSLSALGKIMQTQAENVNADEIFPYWLSQMPIEHDNEEAKEMNDLLADALLSNPQMVIGAQGEQIPKLISMLAGQATQKYMNDSTMEKFRKGLQAICGDENIKS